MQNPSMQDTKSSPISPVRGMKMVPQTANSKTGAASEWFGFGTSKNEEDQMPVYEYRREVCRSNLLRP